MIHASSSAPPIAAAVRHRCVVFLGCLCLTLAGCSTPPAQSVAPAPTTQESETMTQVSTYPALQLGQFDGDVTYAQLAHDGDFGLGTFDGLDGEMIALDGVFYQAKADGSVQVVDPALETPFADVHFFHSTHQIQITTPLQNVAELTAYLSTQVPSSNRPYAFKISATFPTISLRSVPKQAEPYPSLKDAVTHQVVFNERAISGTLVGYALPAYLSGISVTGYHFHFISADKQHGGHMLDVSVTNATVDIDYLENVTLRIPQNATFQQTHFAAP